MIIYNHLQDTQTTQVLHTQGEVKGVPPFPGDLHLLHFTPPHIVV